MSDREPENVTGEQPGRHRDPVNRHPPEEWRPGDPGDPITGGRQPLGEPPHGRSGPEPPVNRHPPEEWRPGDPGDPITGGRQPLGEPPHGHPGHMPSVGRHAKPKTTGAHAYQGSSSDDRPERKETPAEKVGGELSEGPNGPGQAGYERAGYAPGHGESDGEATVPRPPGGPSWDGGPGQDPGTGQGDPVQVGQGMGATEAVPWGRIFGVGCGVVLLVLLISGVVITIALFMA